MDTYNCEGKGGNRVRDSSKVQPAKRMRGMARSRSSMIRRDGDLQPDVRIMATSAAAIPQKAVSTTLQQFQPTLGQFTSSQPNSSIVYEGIARESHTDPINEAASNSLCRLHTPHSPAHHIVSMPASPKDTDFDRILNTLLHNVKGLYVSYHGQSIWHVQDHRKVEEDIHDEFLVGVASCLKNWGFLSHVVSNKGFNNVLEMVGKVIGAGKGADCGLFSLPAILISFLRLIRDGRTDWAQRLIARALMLARRRFGNKHQLVQVLSRLQKMQKTYPSQITEVVLGAYDRCIEDVREQLEPSHLTYLSLHSDFVVYTEGRSVNDAQALIKTIRTVVRLEDEKPGPDAGPTSDFVLELLGMTLYVLQAPCAKPMAHQAQTAAEDLLGRLEKRKAEDGGELKGELLTTWKDLRHVLGQFCLEKKKYPEAISFLEEFLVFEIADERDTCALEKLEQCYTAVGKLDDAREVRRRRKKTSEALLKQQGKSPSERKKDVKDREETNEVDNKNEDGREKSSDATVASQSDDEQRRVSSEEDVTDEDEEDNVEIQLLEEQITGLQQKVTDIKRKRGNKRCLGKKAKKCM